MGRFHPAPHRLDQDALYEDQCGGLGVQHKATRVVEDTTRKMLIHSSILVALDSSRRYCYLAVALFLGSATSNSIVVALG